jgi:flagellar biosynthetic protein FliP
MASFLGVLGVLGFVLALLVLTLRLLKRYAPFANASNQRIPFEVIQRLPLSPKQSLAIVRIGESYVAVSLGEGGVRRITDVAPPPVQAERVFSPETEKRAPDFSAVLRKTFRAGVLILGMAFASQSMQAQQPAQQPAQQQAQQPAPSSSKAAQKTESKRAAAVSADTMIAKLAPSIDLRVGNDKAGGLRLSGTVGVVVMMGLLTLLPTLVLMMTGFTRIFIVLGFLRQALGTQSAPPTQLVAGLALLLTGFVMAPTLSEVNRTALEPWMEGRMEQSAMLAEGVKPFRAFMLRQTREHDLATFMDLSRQPRVGRPEDVPLVVLTSAFVTSELRTSFQIGFALFLPFIVIDVVVASVLMSMGMMMLPPAMISLPFKLLLFVLVDGWTLIVNGLIQSFR